MLSQDSMNMFEFASSQSYNIFDSEDIFYNELCTKFTSENGSDVLLLDRKNSYYNENIILCEDNCDYKNYNIVINKVQCECKIDQKIDQINGKSNFAIRTLPKDFFNKNYFSNLKVMKCYKLFFNIPEQVKNIGSYILFISIICFIILIILFYYNHKIKIFRLIDDLCENRRYEINKVIKPVKPKKSINKRGNNITINNFVFASCGNNLNYNSKNNEMGKKNFKKLKTIQKRPQKHKIMSSANPIKIKKSIISKNNLN